MTARQPVVCIVTAAAKVDADLVWLAMGRGPNTFDRKLTTDPAATPSSPATHWLTADSSSLVSDVAAWQALANGDLPQISGVWGVDEVISAEDAMAATSGANLQVYSASGDVEPLDHCNAILASRGLYWVPPEV